MSTGADALRRRTEFPIPRAHRSSSYKKMLSLCRAALDKPDFVYLLTCITTNLSPAAFLNTSATSLYHPVADEVAMAKMDRCPICNVAVKPENLIRHLNDIHPRHPDRPDLIEKLKEEPGRTQRPKAGRPLRIRRWQIALVVVIVLGGLGAVYVPPLLTGTPALPCIRQEGGVLYHWHTDLTISSGAASVQIPLGIGISTFCLEPVHTHEANGRIHIESDTARLYSIGDFFRVWGKSFGNPTAMHVNGTAVTPSPNAILYDVPETIHLQYDSFS